MADAATREVFVVTTIDTYSGHTAACAAYTTHKEASDFCNGTRTTYDELTMRWIGDENHVFITAFVGTQKRDVPRLAPGSLTKRADAATERLGVLCVCYREA